MWCVGRITAEYRKRMYGLLRIYARPYNAKEAVVCVDEKSKQLLRQTRSPLPLQPGRCAKEDYEYKRAGTRNIFMAVEPKGGRRVVEVTARRAKPDFVSFVKHLVENVYAAAETVHLVLDNLNTHFRKTFVDVLGKAAAGVLLRRVTFHYTPKHASWLNMAEIEIGIMDRQCTGQRIATVELLQTEVESWQQQRNAAKRGIEWRFTRQDADRKLSKHYVP
jgi:DDE superfamily endonuclease